MEAEFVVHTFIRSLSRWHFIIQIINKILQAARAAVVVVVVYDKVKSIQWSTQLIQSRNNTSRYRRTTIVRTPFAAYVYKYVRNMNLFSRFYSRSTLKWQYLFTCSQPGQKYTVFFYFSFSCVLFWGWNCWMIWNCCHTWSTITFSTCFSCKCCFLCSLSLSLLVCWKRQNKNWRSVNYIHFTYNAIAKEPHAHNNGPIRILVVDFGENFVSLHVSVLFSSFYNGHF